MSPSALVRILTSASGVASTVSDTFMRVSVFFGSRYSSDSATESTTASLSTYVMKLFTVTVEPLSSERNTLVFGSVLACMVKLAAPG